MFKFITHRSFFANLLAVIILCLLLLLLFIFLLRGFTRHGEYVKVPLVRGLDIQEASRILHAEGFVVSVEDSAFQEKMPRLAVVWQLPDAGEQVKLGRTVYLTINKAVPPMIEMPNLMSLQFKFAESSLLEYGLKLGDTSYQPNFARNTVLDMTVDGASIKPGTKVPMGTVVSLVLGAGIAPSETLVPSLFGMRLADARVVLEANGLLMGAVVKDGDVSDTGAAFIYRQDPQPTNADGTSNLIHPGQVVDVFVGKQLPVRPDSNQAQGQQQ